MVATPLALGKPVQLLNALYQAALKDPSVELVILTALSFLKPVAKDELSKRFFAPIFDRIYDDYEDLLYEIDRRNQKLPVNVKVIEFFLAAGAYLDNGPAQQDFISTNYTHVIRDLLPYNINVIATLLARQEKQQQWYSFSCSTDLLPDLIQIKKEALLVGEINDNLPYMYGLKAEIAASRFDIIFDDDRKHKTLFSIPKQPLVQQDFLIGLYVSSLIKDDGCLQIGIGSLGDGVAYALVLRQTQNIKYQEMLKNIGISSEDCGQFVVGLFASTEMLVDSYLELLNNGILTKKIMDDNGTYIAHAGFFVGSKAFYKQLCNMSEAQKKSISMRSISEINQLYGDEFNRRAKMKNARFVNSCMKASLLGDISSDALDSGLTVSGVGGQYNFVAMAHELVGGRAVMVMRSTRHQGQRIVSNIEWKLTNITIPRHLRDIVVTEYGIADIRGKTDEDVVKAMLNIADSRFQPVLLQQAKAAKKVSLNYEIPKIHQNNVPASISRLVQPYRHDGSFLIFPFGSELHDDEIELLMALKWLKIKSLPSKLSIALKGFFAVSCKHDEALLDRIGLSRTKSLKDRALRALILGTIKSLQRSS